MIQHSKSIQNDM